MQTAVSQHLLQTGLPALNAAVSGIDRGELVYLAGRPGSGKSVLGLDMADAAAGQVKEQGGTVFYYTLEMSATQQVRRLVAARARINTQLIRTGFRGAYGELEAEELARFNRHAQALRERLRGTLFIHKKPLSVDRLSERLSHAVLTKHCRFVVIDQLDLLEDERRDREHDQISYASKRLKQIARELNLPILCLVQLNREVEHRHGLAEKRPVLPDFRSSGRLEQDADQVWFLFRPSMYEARPLDSHWPEYGGDHPGQDVRRATRADRALPVPRAVRPDRGLAGRLGAARRGLAERGCGMCRACSPGASQSSKTEGTFSPTLAMSLQA